MSTIRASMVSRPTLSARTHQPAALVDGAADHPGAFRLGDRHRLAGHHRFVDERRPSVDDAVDRNFLAGAHPQAIADRDGVDRDVLVAMQR